MIQQRMTYHTIVKELAKINALPEHIKKLIPRSNLSRWKQEDLSKYFGSEINQLGMEWGDKLQTVAEFPKVLNGVIKCIDVYKNILSSSNQFKKVIRDSKDQVVNTILNVKDVIPINEALKLFDISRSTFQNWLIEVKCSCSESYFNIYNRFHPHQLTRPEVTVLRDLLTDEKFIHWPIRSVQSYAFRKNLITASRSTWYKYRKLLGIRINNKLPIAS